ncbi:hypothetical protein ANN_05916 [Periplaneta americana]|uniref:Uncharacterized protein n=1 Tax=Periplaneta americana TaxID=6978 RepID=A0ABQ8TDY5_PERAM|nr:hypothetical protein ANN_05916 [Periplaneta americana]
MAGLCEGGNEPSGSLKAICKRKGEYHEKTPYVTSLPTTKSITASLGLNLGRLDGKVALQTQTRRISIDSGVTVP